jgi:hypothetical protein
MRCSFPAPPRRRDSSAEAELANEPQVLDELRRRNSIDLELYRYAEALHEAQLREEGLLAATR